MVRNLLRIYLVMLGFSTVYSVSCGGILLWANYQVDHKDTKEALRFYQYLGRIAPGYPDIFVWQGWRECELGNYPEARALAERARRQNPESAEVPALLGQIAYLEGRFEEALQYWKENPAGRAWAYYELGRINECRQSLGECRGNEPGLDDLRKALEELGEK